ncbi:hypothetical protein M0208_05590 [Sphingomonas sp. SUN019]|uniref:hypothetical protein n=1 Tax=Sphingomonas sp. SUN019 TaxID=2937788 RepID=UPI0021643A4B|nr:hypothetical protein [Sphingomonas sp. SUN019]UVO50016.1 hypothetical protein M0208_05590 [Sphingomonas sp. SUN019]
MNGIDRLSSAPPLSALDAGSGGVARTAATQAIGEIGHRALAWVGAIGGDSAGSAAWAERAGATGGFSPDASVLAQRGDVYGLNDMARGIAGQFGATPTQEGELRRAMEDFTRAAVIQVAGLSGPDGARQVAGLGDALDAAAAGEAGGGVDEVVARLETATATLSRANGG